MWEPVAQLGLNWQSCFSLATLKRGDTVVHSASGPILFKSPASDTYMLVGKSYFDNTSPEPDRVAADKSSEAESALVPEDNVGCCLTNKQAEFVALVGLKFVPGVTSATFNRTDDAVFTVSKTSVFKSPWYDLYFVFGETKIDNYKTPRELEDLYYKELELRFPPDDIKKLMDAFGMEKREALDCLDIFDGDASEALASDYRESTLADL